MAKYNQKQKKKEDKVSEIKRVLEMVTTAEFLLESNRLNEALEMIREAYYKLPLNKEVLTTFCRVHFEAGLFLEMLEASHNLYQMNPNIENTLNYAQTLSANYFVGLASELFKKIRTNPKLELLDGSEKLLTLSENVIKEAQAVADRMFTASDANERPSLLKNFDISRLRLQQGRFEDSAELHKQIISKAPYFLPAYNNLMVCKIKLAEYEEISSIASAVLERDSLNGFGFFNKVLSQIFLGETPEIPAHFRQKLILYNAHKQLEGLLIADRIDDIIFLTTELLENQDFSSDRIDYVHQICGFASWLRDDFEKAEEIWRLGLKK